MHVLVNASMLKCRSFVQALIKHPAMTIFSRGCFFAPWQCGVCAHFPSALSTGRLEPSPCRAVGEDAMFSGGMMRCQVMVEPSSAFLSLMNVRLGSGDLNLIDIIGCLILTLTCLASCHAKSTSLPGGLESPCLVTQEWSVCECMLSLVAMKIRTGIVILCGGVAKFLARMWCFEVVDLRCGVRHISVPIYAHCPWMLQEEMSTAPLMFGFCNSGISGGYA